MSQADKHFEMAVNISVEALKAILFVNAGAAAALIALTDKAKSGSDYSIPIVWFGSGAVVTVIAFAFGYFSQLHYANHRMAIENREDGTSAHRIHLKYQLAAITAVVIAVGCASVGIFQAYSVAHQNNAKIASALPTAIETFGMRTKCAEWGQKLLDNDTHGPNISVDQKSHYNPQTNRCYVELDSSNAGIDQAGYNSSQYLYDGQTGEMLAWFSTKRKDSTAGEVLTCAVLDYANLSMQDPLRQTGDERCRSINARILALMTDDRSR